MKKFGKFFQKPSMLPVDQKPRLLPWVFKIIGIGVTAAGLFWGPLSRLFGLELPREAIVDIRLKILIAGLFLIAWSRDRVQDEMTIIIRYKALEMAFYITVIANIFIYFLDTIFNHTSKPDTDDAKMIIFQLLFLFILFYHMLKSRYQHK